ncbi:hypothetical protein A2630_00050 [Candidatus Woesebacteria bacterium RIFCSPHIGHO2_01_FULL_44_10]|uniref:Glycosyltransferase 2-like domain-containing protein n=1 Tax=Candidatus Woesebacteria bacterium RIFCSPLOWO2_01_FULL_44_14 TaxID=1802525 RepID=A0A1F8BXC8_9BACT|nr:MAG: hypothetical protein A2630_00050 [Candidatus Woesebacteria bacterium RIFCSPHIGHO2_01_FULL_44_10]OGM56266.1 MAG: hypothetical protein A3F62_03370 [Candidatus Woesebacteria bacterium RIFCSPHIGHO2_12_FULL_44_11]OGM68702.1 MAG: hypothetical protein A2975_05350 [Candidatus Woesebacteria bacterium RIFCSPLOWO2_01_FULL_44_14]
MSRKIHISAVVLTRDNATVIERCLTSVRWAEEVVVIDDFSVDKTVGIAKKFGGRIFRRHLNNDWAAQRNFALRQAQGKWVLFIDSDEVVSPALRDEILNLQFTIYNQFSSFKIQRRDVLWGRKLKYGESGNIKLLRLAKRSAGKWQRAVHEYWDVKGRVGTLKNELVHYPHQTLKQFITQINFHSSLHAKENAKEGKKSSIIKIITYPVFKFFLNYILRLGLLDGIHGFVAAAIMSWHSFIAWSKMYIWQKN